MDIRQLGTQTTPDKAKLSSESSRRAEAGAPTNPAAAERSDTVELSESGQALTASAGEAPFNQAKVDAIRQAIEQGEYHVDAQRLAENFTRLEGELFS